MPTRLRRSFSSSPPKTDTPDTLLPRYSYHHHRLFPGIIHACGPNGLSVDWWGEWAFFLEKTTKRCEMMRGAIGGVGAGGATAAPPSSSILVWRPPSVPQQPPPVRRSTSTSRSSAGIVLESVTKERTNGLLRPRPRERSGCSCRVCPVSTAVLST